MGVSDRRLDDRLLAQAVYQSTKVLVERCHKEGGRGQCGKPNAALLLLEHVKHVEAVTVGPS